MGLQRVPKELKTEVPTLKHTFNHTTQKDETRGGLMNKKCMWPHMGYDAACVDTMEMIMKSWISPHLLGGKVYRRGMSRDRRSWV